MSDTGLRADSVPTSTTTAPRRSRDTRTLLATPARHCGAATHAVHGNGLCTETLRG